MKKLKTYVLTISRYFPQTHKRACQETKFIEKISCACFCPGECGICDWKEGKKIHTIRSNYELWKNRIDQVNEGKAVLSLRYWSGKPYHKDDLGYGQVEFLQLKQGECGVQKIEFRQLKRSLIPTFEGMANRTTCIELAKNDGLQLEDFKEWFKGYNLSEPMAIIHFTNFRY